MNKRHIVLSILNGSYFVQFIQADGNEHSNWDYHALHDANKDMNAWLADDSKVPDKTYPKSV
jgi:hypothetical protein